MSGIRRRCGMTRSERAERRSERLHAIGDAVLSLLFYGTIWIVFMVIIGRMLMIF